MTVGLQVAGAVGLCLSLYAVYVEYKNEEDPSYEAACDISERMSCSRSPCPADHVPDWQPRVLLGMVEARSVNVKKTTTSKVLTSEWGHIASHLGIIPRGHPLDLANATLGVLYFSVVTLHRLLPLASHRACARFVFALTLPVVVISLYLAYILFAVLQDICVLCMGIYAVNLTVLVLSYRRGYRGPKAAQGQDSPVVSKADEAKSD
ncbi:unnamed protein product [Ascophyllum nodosum]